MTVLVKLVKFLLNLKNSYAGSQQDFPASVLISALPCLIQLKLILKHADEAVLKPVLIKRKCVPYRET